MDEGNERQAPPPLPPTVPHVSVPLAKPVAGKPPTATIPAAPNPGAQARSGEGKKHKKSRGKKRPPPPPAPAAPAETFDVELVPVPPARTGRGLTRRDFALFFAGAGVSALAFVLGRVLAGMFAKKEAEEK